MKDEVVKHGIVVGWEVGSEREAGKKTWVLRKEKSWRAERTEDT